MGFFNFINPYEEEEEDEVSSPNLSSSMRNPYLMNLGESNSSGSVVSDYNDEDKVKKFLELSQQRSPSQDIIEDYISRRPSREDFKPSFGRKLLAALAGGLGGATRNPLGINLGREILTTPYRNALKEHEAEGKFVDDQARMADRQRSKELEAQKFELIEGRRKTDAQNKREFERTKFGAGLEAKRVAEEQKAEKERKTEERQRLSDERSDRRLQLAEESARRAEKSAREVSRGRQIGIEQKRQKAQANRAQFATIRAHQMIKSKPEFAQFFNDPDDEKDFTLRPDLPESQKQELQFLIRDMEDTLRKSYGLPGAFSGQGYIDIEDEEDEDF